MPVCFGLPSALHCYCCKWNVVWCSVVTYSQCFHFNDPHPLHCSHWLWECKVQRTRVGKEGHFSESQNGRWELASCKWDIYWLGWASRHGWAVLAQEHFQGFMSLCPECLIRGFLEIARTDPSTAAFSHVKSLQSIARGSNKEILLVTFSPDKWCWRVALSCGVGAQRMHSCSSQHDPCRVGWEQRSSNWGNTFPSSLLPSLQTSSLENFSAG